jgi:polyisoprenoid-binding protein YceI
LYIVAIAFVSASYYRDDKASNFFVSIAILSVLPALLHSAPNEVVSLTDGDVLSGLFIGLFGVFLIQKLWNSKKRNYTTIGLVYLLFLGLSFFILWLGTLYFKLGGIDAAIAIFVGMSLANAIVGRGFVTASIFMILLGGVLVIPDFLVNEEQLMFERQNKIIDTVNLDDSNSVRSNRLSLNDLKGRHSLISKSSSVQFFLGNQGQTKGAFKKIKGSISIDENMEKSSLEIILPMSEFTTFVSMRDASLRGDDYFRVDQFPNMKYEAVGFNEVDSNLFEVTGNFTMLGITKELIVTLQRIKAEGNHVIVGSGKIDRTLFGMTPNASEGNIVTFNYRAEF